MPTDGPSSPRRYSIPLDRNASEERWLALGLSRLPPRVRSGLERENSHRRQPFRQTASPSFLASHPTGGLVGDLPTGRQSHPQVAGVPASLGHCTGILLDRGQACRREGDRCCQGGPPRNNTPPDVSLPCERHMRRRSILYAIANTLYGSFLHAAFHFPVLYFHLLQSTANHHHYLP